MSRTTLKTALVTALTAALTPDEPEAVPAAPVAKWDGEEAVFNQNRLWPALFVAYAGTEFGDQLEIGPDQATYERAHIFQVFYATAHTAATAGDEQAMELMAAVETGVSGLILAELAQAEILGEELVHVHMGRFLYVQTWRLALVESH
jgi:hypothetical protein